MKLLVVDGKGGGLGKAIIESIRKSDLKNIQVLALGTNGIATQNMLKAGADDGATGENAILHMAPKADVIVGPLAIIHAGGMMGEISFKMANAISESEAIKMLLPTNQCHVEILDLKMSPLKSILSELIEKLKNMQK